jgi:hypothetical protein
VKLTENEKMSNLLCRNQYFGVIDCDMMTRKEIRKRYYEKHKEKLLAKNAKWQKLPHNQTIRNERKRKKRESDPIAKRKEYDAEIRRRLAHPLKKLANTSNHNAKKRIENFYKVTAWDLWKIAKAQKMRCPFTGEKLTSLNASLDHIVPISKGGTNDPSNIRLVIKWVNLMRLNYSDEEFIEICHKIASYCPRKIRV